MGYIELGGRFDAAALIDEGATGGLDFTTDDGRNGLAFHEEQSLMILRLEFFE